MSKFAIGDKGPEMKENNYMSQREALKRLGIAIFGVAAASTGMSSLTSCAEKKIKRVIPYFTGTGNCLYIARKLAGKDGDILSIPQLVKRGNIILKPMR